MQKLFLRFRVKTSLLISENVDTELVYNFNVIIIIVFFSPKLKILQLRQTSCIYNAVHRSLYFMQYIVQFNIINIIPIKHSNQFLGSTPER